MAPFFFSVAVLALLLAAYWSQRAWGTAAALTVVLVGAAIVRFVPLPFGTLLAALGAVPLVYWARSAMRRPPRGPPPGEPVPGEPDDEGGGGEGGSRR